MGGWIISIGLALLLAVASAVVVRTMRLQKQATSRQKGILAKLNPKLLTRQHMLERTRILLILIMLVSMWGLLATSGTQRNEWLQSNSGQNHLYVVLDNSLSMNVADFDNQGTSRLEGAKTKLLDATKDTQIGTTLATFHSQALIYGEMDTALFRETLGNVVSIPYFATNGSSFGRVMHDVSEDLAKRKEVQPNDRFWLVIISDGEETWPGEFEDSSQTKALREHIAGAIVLGIGSEDGGAVPYNTYQAAQPGEVASIPESFSRLDSQKLNVLAKNLDGSYQKLSADTDPHKLLPDHVLAVDTPNNSTNNWYVLFAGLMAASVVLYLLAPYTQVHRWRLRKKT